MKKEGSLYKIIRGNIREALKHGKFTSGFTLVEMLVYMVILMLFVSIFSVVFREIVDVQLESQATSSVDQDEQFIIARLTHDMQQASAIVVPASAGQQTSTLQITVNSVNYTYSLTGGNLQITNNNGTDNLNSVGTTVSGLTFQRIGSGDIHDTIQVSFTLSSTTQRSGGPETKTYQTTLGLQ